MPKPVPTTDVVPQTNSANSEASARSLTNWRAFEKAGLAPAKIVCQGYAPFHRVDSGCHTKLLLTAEAIRSHAIDREHGGGFQMTVREASKPSRFWSDLETAGLECIDLRCEICDAKIPFHPNHIKPHLKAHQGKVRRIKPGSIFNFTVGVNRPVDDDEAFDSLG